jgi:NTP pyrophosphatase (non-canonical NTP hydrolase)
MNEYQEQAIKSAVYPKQEGIYYTTLGLVGEAGEVAEKVKKMIRDDKTLSECKDDLIHELGDVLWYLANLGNEIGVSLEEISLRNIVKLEGRMKRNTIHGNGDNR